MRLWHKDLIPVLPRQQLLGQWRECCLIAKNIHNNGTPNHLLVNKIIDYPFEHFYSYCYEVACEMKYRGYKVDFYNFLKWISAEKHTPIIVHSKVFEDWHNDQYLTQCYYALQEKYDCGGISVEEWTKITDFMRR